MPLRPQAKRLRYELSRLVPAQAVEADVLARLLAQASAELQLVRAEAETRQLDSEVGAVAAHGPAPPTQQLYRHDSR